MYKVGPPSYVCWLSFTPEKAYPYGSKYILPEKVLITQNIPQILPQKVLGIVKLYAP
jgi:hypothetical protein